MRHQRFNFKDHYFHNWLSSVKAYFSSGLPTNKSYWNKGMGSMLRTFGCVRIFYRSESQVKQPVNSLLWCYQGDIDIWLEISRNQTQSCIFFETWLSWAGDLCLFCGWITLVPVIPWEEESSVSSRRKSEDWGQAEILPCGFATSLLNNLSEGRSSLSQTESSRIYSEVKKNSFTSTW